MTWPRRLYTYTATDADGETDSLTFTITIDQGIAFGPQSIPNQRYSTDRDIDTLTLPEPMVGNEPFSYSLMPTPPPPLSFNDDTRTLSGTAPNREIQETTYTYTATDRDEDADSLTFTITIELDELTDFDQSIAAHQYDAGMAIAPLTLPEASTGNSPFRYRLTPAPPEGLTFNAEARPPTLIGTPSNVNTGVRTYTYTATDVDDDTASLSFTITILYNELPQFAPDTPNQWFISAGHDIGTVILPQVSRGDAPLLYSLRPTLPEGLVFQPSTRAISGTAPNSPQTFSYFYRATELFPPSGTTISETTILEIFITVEPEQIPGFGSQTIPMQQYRTSAAIDTPPLPEADGGNGNLEYSLTPALPLGLRFDTDARTLIGVPNRAMGYTLYTYTVRDRDGDEAHLTFNISIALEVGRGRPRSLELDVPNNHIYWSDSEAGKIRRVNLDRTEVQDIAQLDEGVTAYSLELDVPNNHIYLAHHLPFSGYAPRIDRIDLNQVDLVPYFPLFGDGGDELENHPHLNRIDNNRRYRTELVNLSSGNFIIDLAVDLTSESRKMYWTNPFRYTIQRANLSGSSVETIVNLPETDLSDQKDIVTDGRKVYWANNTSRTIQRANLDGTEVEDFITGLGRLIDLAIGDKIYWINDDTNTIQRANLDGTGVETIVE